MKTAEIPIKHITDLIAIDSTSIIPAIVMRMRAHAGQYFRGGIPGSMQHDKRRGPCRNHITDIITLKSANVGF